MQVCFSQTKISELDSRKKKAERRGRKPERSKSGSKIVPAEEQEDIVGCQCGFEKEEDAMVMHYRALNTRDMMLTLLRSIARTAIPGNISTVMDI